MSETRYPAGCFRTASSDCACRPDRGGARLRILGARRHRSRTSMLSQGWSARCSLASRTPTSSTLELAADVTAEMIAPAADCAYPESGRGASRRLVERVEDPRRAASLVESVASRTDIYALPTTRAEWRRALGVASRHRRRTRRRRIASQRSRRWTGEDLVLRRWPTAHATTRSRNGSAVLKTSWTCTATRRLSRRSAGDQFSPNRP